MPVALVRGALADARAVLQAVDADPAWRRERPAPAHFNPYSSSLLAADVVGLDLQSIARELLEGPAGPTCRALVDSPLALDLDQCWVRRQYAPGRYPALHAPHAWHQDGALAFDFLEADRASSHDRLLSMATCWIALTPCGDRAPGLELVADDIDTLLCLDALTDDAVRRCHAPPSLHRPTLEPGDAVVFGGGVLHHTHVSPTMTDDRTSLELRFFPADRRPRRLCGDRFLDMT